MIVNELAKIAVAIVGRLVIDPGHEQTVAAGVGIDALRQTPRHVRIEVHEDSAHRLEQILTEWLSDFK
jgi:hypothetical protein